MNTAALSAFTALAPTLRPILPPSSSFCSWPARLLITKTPETVSTIQCFAKKSRIDAGNDGFVTVNFIVARLHIMLQISVHPTEFLGISRKSFPNQHPHLGIPSPCDAMPREVTHVSSYIHRDLGMRSCPGGGRESRQDGRTSPYQSFKCGQEDQSPPAGLGCRTLSENPEWI